MSEKSTIDINAKIIIISPPPPPMGNYRAGSEGLQVLTAVAARAVIKIINANLKIIQSEIKDFYHNKAFVYFNFTRNKQEFFYYTLFDKANYRFTVIHIIK
ncbi:hypothetical protein [Treponema pedis]|uniref:Uncharacterized protein n=1 Tax=Treponema pedis TaxID=409322 RepID=A0A7S6WNX7_9SPIR|nr:hypothetical protein [Treponema pedis]QOW60628.1 hypothetical protein IFE08_12615 [Treponema pedis]